MGVKGEANYQRELRAIAGAKTEGGYSLPVVAVLVREPKNPADKNTIAVHAKKESDGKAAVKVGYVNRQDAARIAPALDRMNRQGEAFALEGFIRGGWDRGGGDVGHYGIRLSYDPEDFK